MQSFINPPHQVIGTVVIGDRQGTNIGFPTANLEIDSDLSQVEPGVYLSNCQLLDLGNSTSSAQFENEAEEQLDQSRLKASRFAGLAYYGPRLIFDETINIFEVYLINFSHQIYGAKMEVELTHFIRPPQNFTSIEELKSQLELDLSQALQILGQNN